MRPRIERKCFSLKHAQLVLPLVCLCLSAASTFATTNVNRVLIRPDVSRSHRDELVKRLRAITGLTNLTFDSDGSLRLDGQAARGSEHARALLADAVSGANVIVLEDASSRADVAFCRVVRGRWVRGEAGKPAAYVVLIDFTDFEQLSGDVEARAAFDVGWGLLHEIDHVVTGSEDSTTAGVVGECEEHINQMRRELGLPVRADYFFSRAYLNADANFTTRYVRLSFERRDELSSETKRYWLVWDAVSVGGST
ncbi:MAG TPA: hypothetical protein VJ875_17690 [Pyrinomonadaceae bacterium]|nr:hypothetical protein [Pyrinomonadaceae bacterium]